MRRKVYMHRFECEHDGDVRREVMELEEAGAEIVFVHEDEHDDSDYMTTVLFTVAQENVERFENEIGALCDFYCREEEVAK